MSSLQQVVKQSEAEEKLKIKELIATTQSLDAAAAEVSANRRSGLQSTNSNSSINSAPLTNPYYASQATSTVSSSAMRLQSGERGSGRNSSSGRGGRSGRGRGGRGGRGGRNSGRSSYRGSGMMGRGGTSGFVPVCKFFRQGRCTEGVNCRFRHTQEAAREGAYMATLNSYSSTSYAGFTPSKNFTIGIDAKTGAGVEDDDAYLMNNDITPDFDYSNSSNFNSDYSDKNYNNTKRQYCHIKAAAIQKAKDLQDMEERPYESMEGPFYSIDVECVAVGYGHTPLSKDRIPGRIAMVDEVGNTVVDEIVRFDDSNPAVVVSFLTPLTGLTKSLCARESNKAFDEIVALVKTNLPNDAVLVGQSIHHDIEWLGLEKGTDFRDSVDIGMIFRQRVPLNLNQIPVSQDVSNSDQKQEIDDKNDGETEDELPTKYRIFSLRHTCLYLLGVDVQTSFHNPVIDAKYSVELFNKYRQQSAPGLRAARDSLHRAPVTPSFAAMNPVLDGVCLTKIGYEYKHAGRFIWKWWTSLHGGVYALKPLALQK